MVGLLTATVPNWMFGVAEADLRLAMTKLVAEPVMVTVTWIPGRRQLGETLVISSAPCETQKLSVTGERRNLLAAGGDGEHVAAR